MNAPDMIDEVELRDLFAPRRPNAERFAAGVAERMHRPQRREPADRSGLPKVAAWLPFPITGPKALIWLSMPVLLLAGSWLLMLGAARSIDGALAGQLAPGRHRPVRRDVLTTGIPLAVVLSSLVFSLFGWPYLFDGVIAMVLVSMLALTWVVHLQARAGVADRPAVALLCVGLLELLLTITVVHTLFGFAGIDDADWMPLAAIAVALGLLAMVRYATARVLAALWSVGFLIFLTQFQPWRTSSMDERPPTITQVQEFVTSPHLAPRDVRLRAYAATVASLRTAGVTIEPARDWRRLAGPVAAATGYDSNALTMLAYGGLLSHDAWSEVASHRQVAFRLRELTEGAGPLALRAYDGYLLAALAHEELPARQIEHVVARVERSWPAPDDRAALQRCRLLTFGLDQLGRSELADGHRELVHALLVDRQQHLGFDRGGFAERPDDGDYPPLPCDDVAMALIARFGVPAQLDVHALRRHLEREAKLPASELDVLRDQAFAACAHLQLLESMGPLPQRSLPRLLVDERTFFAVLALVLLCLYAVRRAPAKVRPTAVVLP